MSPEFEVVIRGSKVGGYSFSGLISSAIGDWNGHRSPDFSDSVALSKVGLGRLRPNTCRDLRQHVEIPLSYVAQALNNAPAPKSFNPGKNYEVQTIVLAVIQKGWNSTIAAHSLYLPLDMQNADAIKELNPLKLTHTISLEKKAFYFGHLTPTTNYGEGLNLSGSFQLIDR